MRPWALPFILLAGLVTPSLALASLPPCCYSTVPSCVSLVGAYGAVPAADGEFTVVIRDFANNPVAGAVVVFDLSNAPDMSFCSDQLDPAATVNCAGRTVSKVTAVDGSVRFTLLGGSNGAGNAISLLSAGRIFANGYLISTSGGTLLAQRFDPASGRTSGNAVALAEGVAPDFSVSRVSRFGGRCPRPWTSLMSWPARGRRRERSCWPMSRPRGGGAAERGGTRRPARASG